MPITTPTPTFGKKYSIFILLIASCLLLLCCLGSREIWTQEHRWADIVSHMFYSHDFFHPWLNGQPYYDKPLLSYWLISGFALLIGKLSPLALRLPSALAGLVALFAIYQLGTRLRGERLGLLACWMLLTTFYFLFWSRTSSADMLNMAGTLSAVSWYYCKKSAPGFFDYLVFYLIIAFTALCKGLIAPAVTGLAILPDLLTAGEWRRHLRPLPLLAALPALALYLLPFWASATFGGDTYHENGLALVWRENVLRYFQPFDHKGPVYTYFLFLPVYLLPWTLFFVPALFSFRKRLMSWSVALLFVFLTLSGSRRNYYILPVVPFALLMTADWILDKGPESLRYRLARWLTFTTFMVFSLAFLVLQPLYYHLNSLERFALQVKTQAEHLHPWTEWQVILLDPQSKLRFYLGLPPDTALHEIVGSERTTSSRKTVERLWPLLATSPSRPTLYVTREAWKVPLSQRLGPHYRVLETPDGSFQRKDANRPVAFIPDK